MTGLTRAALIDAAAKAWTDSPLPGDFARRRAADALDAVLPRIADAIEDEAEREKDMLPPRWPGDSFWDGVTAGKRRAAFLTRSLLEADDDH